MQARERARERRRVISLLIGSGLSYPAILPRTMRARANTRHTLCEREREREPPNLQPAAIPKLLVIRTRGGL